MKILFFGSSDFSVPFLKEIYESKHSISLVITGIDKRKGRGKKFLPNPVKKWAIESVIDFFQIKTLDFKFINYLKDKDFNCVVVVSFGMIIPKDLLKLCYNRCINVHPSLLPKYRGPSPITSPILNGDNKTGISIIRMTEKVDEGDIYIQDEFIINSSDNKDMVEKKLIKIGCPLLISVLDLIEEKGMEPVPQDNKNATYTNLIDKKDLNLDWNNSAINIVNKIRAFSSKPGSFSTLNGKRIKILKASFCNDKEIKYFSKSNGGNGTVISADKKSGILIRCNKNEIIRIECLKPSGKNEMSFLDFLNGYKIKVGERFE